MKCTWTEIIDNRFGDEYYETSCGNANEFTAGYPGDNKYKFCPFCGKEIETIKAGE